MKALFTTLYVIICTTMLLACSRSYDPDEAAERGDVVDLHGMITNAERLDEFLGNIEENHSDKVRVTQYTEEADPIYIDLAFDGETVKFKYDNTHDEYAKGKVRTSVCKGISKEVTNKKIEYKLTGCSGKNSDLADAFSLRIQGKQLK
ncbi:hypothetical protein BSK56_27790 [Paenibacillus borealis]|uniref:DUF4362 domain-containing protein n=1 Tax=Paenibacillus borealis TaxID=160799 RepID=A0ABX3GZD2_PAEBO|nr:DUF4362 domain-containing protein [Paenibacillus borealis]OMD41263.1 hypothetical protein BSK56_27790 [Paenibacillus borealis]